jgi:hypothetical protein
MFISNGAVYTKGREKFAQHFKKQLKKNRSWNVEIEWGPTETRSDGQEETSFIVHLYASCTLTLLHDAIEEFGVEANGIEERECQEILDKKERELVRKMQQISKE